MANAGDCRAVLGVQEDDGSWTALPLTRDHNAQNPEELQRVRARHPPSETATVVSEDRLLGVRDTLDGKERRCKRMTNSSTNCLILVLHLMKWTTVDFIKIYDTAGVVPLVYS